MKARLQLRKGRRKNNFKKHLRLPDSKAVSHFQINRIHVSNPETVERRIGKNPAIKIITIAGVSPIQTTEQ